MRTDHQKIGRIYRSLCKASKKERYRIQYCKKQTAKKWVERRHKSQGAIKVIMGIIETLEEEFGFRQRDGESYIKKIKEAHNRKVEEKTK